MPASTTSRLLLLAVTLSIACGCAPRTRWDHTPTEQHIVRGGETLFAIAWRYGKDTSDLARWNDIDDPSMIYPGQVILLQPPDGKAPAAASAPRAAAPLPEIPTGPAPAWRWPVPGAVVTNFGERPGTGTGIIIAGKAGDPVRAAADGRVVYSGGGLIGYGKLIIIKHNDTYLSAYGYNASLLVAEGEHIRRGQRIATMGEGPGREPRLHFEIRQNGKPVNPRQLLPAR